MNIDKNFTTVKWTYTLIKTIDWYKLSILINMKCEIWNI